MRQRIQAAVRAERAGTTGEDQESSTEPPRRGTAAEPAAGVMSPGGERIARANGSQKRHGKPEHAGKPEPKAKTEPVVEREHSVKDGPAVKAEHVGKPSPAVKPGHAAKPEPAHKSRSNGKAPAHHKPAAAVQAEPMQAEPAPTAEDARTGPGPRRFGWVRATAFFLVLIAVGSLATAVSRHFANAPSGNHAVALQRQEALTRLQAASWVAQQVDPADVVSCDQAMCAALRADRFPASKLLLLGPTSQPPVTSAVVVVTATVRSLFGSSLGSAWAPAVLASFGSGTAQITIRLMSSHGAGTFRAALNAGQGDRIAYGQVLLTPRIVLSPTAQTQLAAGQVDQRVVEAIVSLASQEPVDILEFGNIGPDASPYLPLRFADLAVTDSAANLVGSAYLQALQTRLSAVSTEFRPASSQTVPLGHGQDVFRVEFTAPSPLGSIGMPASP